MSPHLFVRNLIWFAFFVCCLSANLEPAVTYAQQDPDVIELKKQVNELVKNQRYTDALPLLERLVVAEPDDPQTHFYLGFALIGQANTTVDDAKRKSLRVRARNAFIKSKELGFKEPIVDAVIQNIPPDGSDGKAFSQNIEANRLMTEAEALFSQGKLDDALANYQKALKLDPRLYEAALFSGDVHMQHGNFEQAEIWYQKAIAIDPNRETAYRYSATPFMKQRKFDQARDRYVEAYISEPYNRYAAAGLTQWAQMTSTKLGHPAIEVPTNVNFDDKGNANVSLDPKTFSGNKEDGSYAWIGYSLTRTVWRKEKFAQTFPQEKIYRHSLAEEADALRTVVKMATTDEKVKKLNESIVQLKKLNDEGLLEAYILLVRVDAGIAADHPAYLKQNRDKLRRYVVQYVLTGGGN
jgi:tetratricopeptide (TPR) repeat protein